MVIARGTRVVAGALVAGAPWLLRRMETHFDAEGRLRGDTTAWMYATYVAHGFLYVDAVPAPCPAPCPTRTRRCCAVVGLVVWSEAVSPQPGPACAWRG